jgi:transcriptional regulator with PAS, ATPase and Fis domain
MARHRKDGVSGLAASHQNCIKSPAGSGVNTPRSRLSEQGQSEDESLLEELRAKLGLRQLIGESPAFLAAKTQVVAIAQYDVNVLISGETGTGKEIFARAIHYLSPRARYPFVPVNCGAIPTDLVENELFGHERGAFTGASITAHGLIREAEGGTLFLDEIDCLPLLAQVKLLRFLQEKEYRLLGSTTIYRADVRVIAAANTELESAVKEGKLRQDLYYRLNVIPLRLPRLQDRREDIPLLARHFLARYAAEFKKAIGEFSPEAMQKLLLYEWPGNVRQGLARCSNRLRLQSHYKPARRGIICRCGLPNRKPNTPSQILQMPTARVSTCRGSSPT